MNKFKLAAVDAARYLGDLAAELGLSGVVQLNDPSDRASPIVFMYSEGEGIRHVVILGWHIQQAEEALRDLAGGITSGRDKNEHVRSDA